MLSAVHAVVVCLSLRLSVRLQIMPHDRPGTLVFNWDVLSVAEFRLTSASRGPSAIAEPLVMICAVFDAWLLTAVFTIYICCFIINHRTFDSTYTDRALNYQHTKILLKSLQIFLGYQFSK